MINGVQYAWEHVTITFPNGTMIGIQEIQYGDKKDGEEQYGKGSMPVGYGEGNYSAEGKAKMSREEFEKFTDALMTTGKAIYKHKPFVIVVSYANEDQPTITDTLRSCKLVSNDTNPKQGDKSIDMEINFKILGGILWNGKEANY
jgi:hypothetical protein